MKGIIEFRDALISADQVIMAYQDGDDVKVTIYDWDDEYAFDNCALADFRDAWRRALRDF